MNFPAEYADRPTDSGWPQVGMGAGAEDIGSLKRHVWRMTRETVRKTRTVAWLVAGSIGAAIALSPIASADTGSDPDPQIPYGTSPYIPYGPQPQQTPDPFGFHPSNHDETDGTNGQVDVPF
jgi:hypothetical protein